MRENERRKKSLQIYLHGWKNGFSLDWTTIISFQLLDTNPNLHWTPGCIWKQLLLEELQVSRYQISRYRTENHLVHDSFVWFCFSLYYFAFQKCLIIFWNSFVTVVQVKQASGTKVEFKHQGVALNGFPPGKGHQVIIWNLKVSKGKFVSIDVSLKAVWAGILISFPGNTFWISLDLILTLF